MRNRRGESPASRLKEAAAHTGSASPRGKRNIPKDKEEDEEEPIRISSQPEAQPPACRKSKLYRNADIFKEFDQRAFEVNIFTGICQSCCIKVFVCAFDLWDQTYISH